MRRGGFSLLEVVLALAILTTAIAVLGELVRSGLRNARLTRDLSQAELLCESTVYQIEAGLLPPQSVPRTPIRDQPGWVYTIEPEGAGAAAMPAAPAAPAAPAGGGLLRLRVTVEQDRDPKSRPAKFSLVRWMRDPSLVLMQQATQPSVLPTTNPAGSSSTSGTGVY